MDTLLEDLYSHQAWADAEQWRAIEACAGGLQDKVLRERLHHICLVQHGFLSVVTGRPFAMTKLGDFSESSLKEYARGYHQEMASVPGKIEDEDLLETITIPWFNDPPLKITKRQALTQAAMHSHYHRGQNASRLKELGGQPPLTDLIVWYWKGRPAAKWE